jgi:hypothetical protein
MAQFRKDGVIVDAYRFHNRISEPADRPTWLMDAVAYGDVVFHSGMRRDPAQSGPDHLIVNTSAGEARANVDDWVIKSEESGLSVVKAGAFEDIYEPVIPPRCPMCGGIGVLSRYGDDCPLCKGMTA